MNVWWFIFHWGGGCHNRFSFQKADYQFDLNHVLCYWPTHKRLVHTPKQIKREEGFTKLDSKSHCLWKSFPPQVQIIFSIFHHMMDWLFRSCEFFLWIHVTQLMYGPWFSFHFDFFAFTLYSAVVEVNRKWRGSGKLPQAGLKLKNPRSAVALYALSIQPQCDEHYLVRTHLNTHLPSSEYTL